MTMAKQFSQRYGVRYSKINKLRLHVCRAIQNHFLENGLVEPEYQINPNGDYAITVIYTYNQTIPVHTAAKVIVFIDKVMVEGEAIGFVEPDFLERIMDATKAASMESHMPKFPEDFYQHCPKVIEAKDWMNILGNKDDLDPEGFAECAFARAGGGMECKVCQKHLTRPFLNHEIDREFLPQIEAYYEAMQREAEEEARRPKGAYLPS